MICEESSQALKRNHFVGVTVEDGCTRPAADHAAVFALRNGHPASGLNRAKAFGTVFAHAGHQNTHRHQAELLRHGVKQDVCRRTMPVDRWAVGEHHQVASRHAPHHHVAIAGANQNAACEEQITRTRFVHFERAALVEALGECCPLEVHEARSGDLLLAGRVLICPGNRHMMVRRMPRGDLVVLSDGPPVNGHRPSADVLFHSAAQEFSLMSVGVVMTGMGEDGAEGLGAIKAAGGMTIAQSEESCVVSGMPRAAILKGYANKVIPLEGLGSFLANNYGAEKNLADKDLGEKVEKDEKPEKTEKHDKPERTPVPSHRA